MLFSAALVVAPTQTPTFVENVGIWVDDHPIVTVVVISSIIFLGGIAITYFVAPHLLGITVAGAAGAVDPLKQLTTQLADAKSEVIVQQGLRVAAEARLGEVSADLDTERVLRFAVQAQANLVNAHTEAAVDAMGVRLREANASVSGLQLQLTQARSLNDTIGVRDSGKQAYLTDLLGKIRLEEVKPSVKMVGGKPILNLSGNCRDFIADHVMDSAQVAHNVIKGTPLQQPLPADVAAKLGANIDPVLNSLLTELIRAMFG